MQVQLIYESNQSNMNASTNLVGNNSMRKQNHGLKHLIFRFSELLLYTIYVEIRYKLHFNGYN